SARLFRNKIDGREHVAIVKGDLEVGGPVLVRVQTENILTDVFGAQPPSLLHASLELINRTGRGVVLYLRESEIRSMFALQRPVMDQRDYGVGAQILRALGVTQMILISHHPVKRVGLKGYGIEIVECINPAGEKMPLPPEAEL